MLFRSVTRRVARHLPVGVRRAVWNLVRGRGTPTETLAVDWIPASRYRGRWAGMRAFAMPSFYDGRIRVTTVSTSSTAAMCMALGKLSFEDWLRLT